MAYTSPDATNEEIHRVLGARALAFFDKLPSPFDAPTWSDLRRVKARMLGYLLPRPEMRRALERESALWDALLVGERQLDPTG